VAGRSRRQVWRDILGLLKEFWLAQPLAWLGTLALLIVGNARTGLYITAIGGAVNALIVGQSGGHSALFWIGVYIFASALEEFHWTVSPVLTNYLRDHGTYRLQQRVLERAAAAPLIQFEEGAFFAHLQRAMAGTGDRLMRVYGQITGSLTSFFMLASIAVALFAVQPFLAPLLVVGTIPSIWLQARVATAAYQAQRAHTTRDLLRAHLERLLTGREAAAEVRLFGSADHLLGQWRRLRRERTADVVGAERRRAWSGALGDTCAGAGYAAALALVAVLILHGQLSIGNYVTVVTGALWFEGTFGGMIAGVRSLEEESQFLGDLFDFWRAAREGTSLSDSLPGAGRENAVRSIVASLARRLGVRRNALGGSVASRHIPVVASPEAQLPVGSVLARRKGGPFGDGHYPPGRVLSPRAGERVRERGSLGILVEAEHARFGYPDGRPVLQDVSLRIGRGERIAIVGENGAGKTTLVKLLTGLYQPTGGVVRLDGVALGPDQAMEARRRVAAVFQDYAAFQLTARENVGFGDLARMGEDGALAAAAARADIATLIAGLPGGFDAYLGREFGQTDVSGGQWQRLALARAFFRDADLLVLDEPTAALDPLAELALFTRFAELVEGRTAIMISHRLGMARLADRVLVLAHGAIVEEGRHADLLAAGGRYARMFEAQAQWYR
jgi:ABC-type multidrug transport system fused ATPase/permease subunit